MAVMRWKPVQARRLTAAVNAGFGASGHHSVTISRTPPAVRLFCIPRGPLRQMCKLSDNGAGGRLPGDRTLLEFLHGGFSYGREQGTFIDASVTVFNKVVQVLNRCGLLE